MSRSTFRYWMEDGKLLVQESVWYFREAAPSVNGLTFGYVDWLLERVEDLLPREVA